MKYQNTKEVITQRQFYEFIAKLEKKIKKNEYSQRIRLNSEFCKTGFYLFSEEKEVYFIIENEKKSLHLKNLPNITGLSIENKKPLTLRKTLKKAFVASEI